MHFPLAILVRAFFWTHKFDEKVFIFVVVGAITGLSLLVESVFGPSYGPLFLALLAGFYILMKRNKIAFRGGKV